MAKITYTERIAADAWDLTEPAGYVSLRLARVREARDGRNSRWWSLDERESLLDVEITRAEFAALFREMAELAAGFVEEVS